MPSSYTRLAQQIYIAFLGRSADPAGLAALTASLAAANAPTSLAEFVSSNSPLLAGIASSFSTSAEFTSRYTGLNTTQSITQLYQNLFGRAPDAAGLAFWSSAVGNGQISLASLPLILAQSAASTDTAALNNKTTVAVAFTESLNTPARIAAYSGNAAAAFNDSLLDLVGSGTDTNAFSALLNLNVERLVAGNLTVLAAVPPPAPAPEPAPAPAGPSIITGTAGVDNLLGTAGADTITGLASNDTLNGGGGDDTLTGGADNDTLTGGTGNDTFNVDAGTDTITDLATGDILVVSSKAIVTATVNTAFVATAGTSNAGTATLNAGETGITLNFSLATGVNGYTLNGASNTGSPDTLVGSANTDTINAQAGDDTLSGGGGNDTLTGGGGNDTLTGGTGNDTFNVDSGTDTITDLAMGDSLIVSVGATANATNVASFADNITNNGVVTISAANTGVTIALSGATGSAGFSVIGGTGNDIFIGSGSADNLSGGDGNDSLTGNNGSDTLTGGAGNDTFRANTGADTITDLATGDILVVSALATANATGITAFVATAATENKGTANLTAAAAGANINVAAAIGTVGFSLNGGAGKDTLVGSILADTLDGGAGVDALTGGAGNDTYVVDDAGDTVTELVSEGTDTVQSSITFTLGSHVENLTLTGTGNINGTGNMSTNTITGNSGNNRLDGGGGPDTLIGGTGDDTYVVNGALTITEAAGQGIDTVLSSLGFALGANLENLTLTGTGNIDGTGNTLVNTITGNSGNNTLRDVGFGDTLIGGLGNDTYELEGDATITENMDEGTDLVISSNSFTLPDHVENLTLRLSSAINGTGNALDNTITGNSGNNTLSGGGGNDNINGGAGADTLTGGAGNDTFNVSSGIDTITDLATGDILVVSTGATANATGITAFVATADTKNEGAASLTAGSTGGTINLALATGTVGFNLIGGSSFDVFTGSDLADDLNGGTNNDNLFGGLGNDNLTGGTGTDTLTGGGGQDSFIFGASLAEVNAAIPNLAGAARLNAADRIADFSGRSGGQNDVIRTGVAGTATNYMEAAAAADYTAAEAAANAAFGTAATVNYYLTDTAANGGLLFVNSTGAGGTVTALIRLTGITSTNFEFADIVV